MKKNKSENKSKKKPLIIIGSLSCILIIGVVYFVMGMNYESTDNAQLDADIVPIKSSVSGYIKAIHFKDNEHVKQGQLLVTIDDTDLKTRVAQSEAALENAKANLISVKSSASAGSQNAAASVSTSSSVQQTIKASKARLTKVQQDYKRIKNMHSAKAATSAQLDAAQAEVEIANAQYEGSLNQYKSSANQSHGAQSQAEAQKAQISLAEALVKQKEAELTLANTQLDYSTIKAPCDGIVTKRAIEQGQFITIAQPLCVVIDNSHLWVTANFKETQVNKIKTGQPVTIKVDAFPDMKLSGVVQSFIGATGAKFSLLPPDNATGNFVKIVQRIPVKIELSNYPKEYTNLLLPGLSTFVEIKTN
ncbi:MAG: HlyD family secretion protein [Bacteroidia bacterium]